MKVKHFGDQEKPTVTEVLDFQDIDNRVFINDICLYVWFPASCAYYSSDLLEHAQCHFWHMFSSQQNYIMQLPKSHDCPCAFQKTLSQILVQSTSSSNLESTVTSLYIVFKIIETSQVLY